ncbi:glycosyltransferase family 4 protein [Phenylobacterium sp.]|uniref:glycosyltransferase family 4 protein n=1 Tax=Phenylobacterium sp. TaxID=1871053 RepID=UPI002F93BA48
MADLSIFHPPGPFGLKTNPFGASVANLGLFRALALHGGFERLQVMSLRPTEPDELIASLLDGASTPTRIEGGVILDQRTVAATGALLRGQPEVADLAWLRRRTVGDAAYSLAGLVHTLAPPFMREMTAAVSVAPTHPWDAIVCTSPSVRDGLTQMFGEWHEYLAERMGGSAPPAAQLPIIPLGVDAARFAGLADRPDARAGLRRELGLADDDVLVIWVGRLSFFEKAFPQAMFKAVQAAAHETGVKLTFALAGWFPGERDRGYYETAARAYAPDVPVHFLDGNDFDQVGALWAAGDIFLSLVDNIQETFGITPIEAMAAGLPVVASDWDGYRSTVRDGVDGFLVPTLLPPAGGLGESMVLRHSLSIDTYQAYVGAVAQHTAVHVGRAARAIAELAKSPDLRRRMGAAGRARIAEAFDWPVVARQYRELFEELGRIRAGADTAALARRPHPVKGDPFRDFRGFATHALSLDGRIGAAPGVSGEDVRCTKPIELDQAFSGWRASLDECARALDLIASGRATTVRQLLLEFPVERRRAVELGVAWMAKLGLVDWLT